MEIKDYLALMRRWWWLLLIGVVLGTAGGYASILLRPEPPTIYQAKTTLMIGNFLQSANPSSGQLSTSGQLAQSYAQLITREPILGAVVEELGLETNWTAFQGAVSAQLVPNTQLFEIYVKHTDPELATALVEEIARQLIQQTPGSSQAEKVEQETRQQFVSTQLKELQQKIERGQQQLQDLEAMLEMETTPEGIRRRQQEIETLQSKISSWQSTYASLASLAPKDQPNPMAMSVVEPAVVRQLSSLQPQDIRRNLLIGAVIGGGIAFGIAYLREYLDDTVRSTEQIEQLMELPTLGTVPKIGSKGVYSYGYGRNASANDRKFPLIEAYRALRTNIQFSSLLMTESATSMLITSAGAGEGKSTTAANLAMVIAQAGKQVILVDADLRRPTLHKAFKLPNEMGLSNLLVENDFAKLEMMLAETKIKNLRVLPSGPMAANAADLLGTPRMRQLVTELEAHTDLVIFDSPPVLIVADAAIMATIIDSVLLVIEAGKTRQQLARRAKESLEKVGGKIIGIVLNKFDPRHDSGYGYSYSGYYNYYTSTSNGQEPKQQPVETEQPSL